jgi:hypothetical protein
LAAFVSLSLADHTLQQRLIMLAEARMLFDPLQVKVCPACLTTLREAPHIADGHCTLCTSEITAQEAGHAANGNNRNGSSSAISTGSDWGCVADRPQPRTWKEYAPPSRCSTASTASLSQLRHQPQSSGVITCSSPWRLFVVFTQHPHGGGGRGVLAPLRARGDDEPLGDVAQAHLLVA